MKVLDLRCAHGHAFEGWFADGDEFTAQQARGLVECPLCGDQAVQRTPSAPRLNLSVAPTEPAGDGAAQPRQLQLQAQWMHAVRRLLERTEDVGERFSEEARRIHYGEVESRGIRGQASAEQRAALLDEGIEVLPLPLPSALKEPLQ